MKLTISRAAFIAAASVVQAKHDIRYYLNGILFEKGPDNHPIIVSTDGHRLFAAVDENSECPDGMPAQTIIAFGAETLRAVKLVKNLDEPLVIDLQSIPAPAVTVTFGSSIDNGSEVIVGKFPYWRRIAKNTSGKSAGWFNAQYIADFQTIGRYLATDRSKGSNALTIRSDGPETSACVFFSKAPSAFGVIMPMRTDIKNPSLPTWAVGPFKKDSKAA